MRFLFWKALIGLTVFDSLLLVRNFATLHRIVRNWKSSAMKASPNTAERICDAVNLACSWYPKRALCLQRSAVTTCLLRSYGIAAEMVIGAQKLPFKAHAWVEVAGRAVNERTDVQTIYGIWERC
jgi:transglutaminase superfamily protein